MPRSHLRVWATGMGIAAGLVVAVVLLTTLGVALSFMASWTCVPAHSPDPDAAGCTPTELKLRLAAVLAVCLAPAWPAFALTRRWVLKRSGR